jgi:hypothetical protein
MEVWLFDCSLINGAVRDSDFIVSIDMVILNNELEKMWKEAVVA